MDHWLSEDLKLCISSLVDTKSSSISQIHISASGSLVVFVCDDVAVLVEDIR